MSAKMRAKMRVTSVVPVGSVDGAVSLNMSAVGKDGAYPDDGTSEDNTYATFTPSANLSMHVNNPALADKFEVGDTYYVDFTAVEPSTEQ